MGIHIEIANNSFLLNYFYFEFLNPGHRSTFVF